MRTKIVEATQGFNFGKFLVGQLDEEEIAHQSRIDVGRTTVISCGYRNLDGWRWVLDLQTGEGIFVQVGGVAAYDLNDKHKVWVCPMFEPALTRIYAFGPIPVEDLPDLLELTEDEAPGAIYGYRRGE